MSKVLINGYEINKNDVYSSKKFFSLMNASIPIDAKSISGDLISKILLKALVESGD
jgi:hypothetical protein